MKHLYLTRMRVRQTGPSAFTRLELVAVLSAVCLLFVVVLPVLANTKPRADRVTCMNNLRLVGRAEHVWASDHGDLMPWWVDVSEGGTQHSILQNNAWFNYGVMTNELGTPTILACPSDPGTRPARDFSFIPAQGFFHAGNKNNSVSYFIGLHTFLTDPAWASGYAEGIVQKALAGDRNLKPIAVNQGCSAGVSVAALVNSASNAHWTNAVHGLVGNILMVDGQVTQNSNSRLVESVAPSVAFCVSHLLMPH